MRAEIFRWKEKHTMRAEIKRLFNIHYQETGFQALRRKLIKYFLLPLAAPLSSAHISTVIFTLYLSSSLHIWRRSQTETSTTPPPAPPLPSGHHPPTTTVHHYLPIATTTTRTPPSPPHHHHHHHYTPHITITTPPHHHHHYPISTPASPPPLYPPSPHNPQLPHPKPEWTYFLLTDTILRLVPPLDDTEGFRNDLFTNILFTSTFLWLAKCLTVQALIIVLRPTGMAPDAQTYKHISQTNHCKDLSR